MKLEKINRIVWIVASFVMFLVVAGFWFSTDSNATILGRYSTRMALQFGLITVVGYLNILILRFLLLPQEVGLSEGNRRVISFRTKLLAAVALYVLGLLATEGILRWNRHQNLEKGSVARREKAPGFDPFLQVVPILVKSATHLSPKFWEVEPHYLPHITSMWVWLSHYIMEKLVWSHPMPALHT